jgi:epoxyqueuosine reductase
MDPDPLQTSLLLKQAALVAGFDKVGIAHINNPPDLSGISNWLSSGYQADMNWMNTPKRLDPRLILPGVRSLVCVALNYYAPVTHCSQLGIAKISRYAWGRDYHRVLAKRLKTLSLWVEHHFPCHLSRYYVDTGPIAEKPWAMQAGIGWIGKNSLLLTREFGSWIFLGILLTTLEAIPDPPHTAHCGSCTRCLEACPTTAIVSPQVVDARLCIAYHTLESHEAKIPANIAQQLQGWVAGCDICQDVCPWNQRFARPTSVPDFYPYPWNQNPALEDLTQLNAEQFSQLFPASTLRRLKVHRLRRNAQAALQAEIGSS